MNKRTYKNNKGSMKKISDVVNMLSDSGLDSLVDAVEIIGEQVGQMMGAKSGTSNRKSFGGQSLNKTSLNRGYADQNPNVYTEDHMAISEEDDCDGRKITRSYDSQRQADGSLDAAKEFYDRMTEGDERLEHAARREHAIKNAFVMSEIISEPMCKKRKLRRGR